MKQRLEYLESQPQTDENKIKIDELTLSMVGTQQLLLAEIGKDKKINKDFFFQSGGKEHIKNHLVIADLLQKGILFANTRKYLELDGEPQEFTIVLFLICNELFNSGADAECINCSDLSDIYKASFEPYGIDKWVCRKRNMKPQDEIVEDMKKSGHWDSEMDNLKDNDYLI